MLPHFTFQNLCKSAHSIWCMRSFSKLFYWVPLHQNLMSSRVYRQPFSFISHCYDFQSISTVSFASPQPSFLPTLAEYFWISFTIFRVLIMGLWGCIGTCWVFASFPPQQMLSVTHLWYQYPFHHLLQDDTKQNCHQTNSLHYIFLFWHLREALRSDLVGLWWTKRQILKQLLCAAHQETSHGWEHACPHHEC